MVVRPRSTRTPAPKSGARDRPEGAARMHVDMGLLESPSGEATKAVITAAARCLRWVCVILHTSDLSATSF
jgi:hypothetical protein